MLLLLYYKSGKNLMAEGFWSSCNKDRQNGKCTCILSLLKFLNPKNTFQGSFDSGHW